MRKGFTLLEIIVALGIFSVAILIAVGSLLLMITAQRKALAIQAPYDNLRFSLEVMAKELRTGTLYQCNNTIPTAPTGASPLQTIDCTLPGAGNSAVSFKNRQGDQVSYRLNIVNGKGYIEKFVNPIPWTFSVNWIPLTGDDVDIEDLRFYVTGSPTITSGDFRPPVITIVVEGQAGQGSAFSRFNLQTSVVQRRKDVGQ